MLEKDLILEPHILNKEVTRQVIGTNTCGKFDKAVGNVINHTEVDETLQLVRIIVEGYILEERLATKPTEEAKDAMKEIKDVYPGSIILMHDIHPTTIDALPEIITFLKDQNYEIVTISDLLNSPTKPHNYYGIGDNRPVE